MHRHSPLCEWERDPARSDPELESASTLGELGEELDGRLDDVQVEHVRSGLVVRGGDAFVEVTVVVVHSRNVPDATLPDRQLGCITLTWNRRVVKCVDWEGSDEQ